MMVESGHVHLLLPFWSRAWFKVQSLWLAGSGDASLQSHNGSTNHKPIPPPTCPNTFTTRFMILYGLTQVKSKHLVSLLTQPVSSWNAQICLRHSSAKPACHKRDTWAVGGWFAHVGKMTQNASITNLISSSFSVKPLCLYLALGGNVRLQWEEAQKESGQPAGKPSLWNTCREFISETPSCNMQCLQVTNILNDSEQLDKL